jgi:hypothetical protein
MQVSTLGAQTENGWLFGRKKWLFAAQKVAFLGNKMALLDVVADKPLQIKA